MNYFSQDYLDFFAELKNNNSKDWFDANRKRYEKSVKVPFKEFVELIIARVQADDPDFLTTPKESIFRINRDIRFSKDKTPYKTSMSALLIPGGKKNKGLPGIHFSFGAEKLIFHGGVFMPEKGYLEAIRRAIVEDPKALRKLITDKEFLSHFGELQGEPNKRIPAEFQETYKIEPLIANKQFYFMTELPSAELLTQSLADTIVAHYLAGRPLLRFLQNAAVPV